jgi:hypothetical protein
MHNKQEQLIIILSTNFNVISNNINENSKHIIARSRTNQNYWNNKNMEENQRNLHVLQWKRVNYLLYCLTHFSKSSQH